MKLYHKQVNFNDKIKKNCISITDRLNKMPVKFTQHAQKKLFYRFYDKTASVVDYIRAKKFTPEELFEIGRDEKGFKVGFRIASPLCNYKDLIVVFNRKKAVVTLWENNKGDNHKTLDRRLYVK